MDDQVSQNARVEAAEEARRWGELSRQEQAAALVGLADYLATRQDFANTRAARSHALAAAGKLTAGQLGESPIPWPSLTDRERASHLREVAFGTRAVDQQWSDHALDLAEQMERTRQQTRDDRGR